MPHYTKPFPIPEIPNGIAKELEQFVDDILISKTKDKNTETTELEGKIDRIIYDLYDLTSEEIKFIEKI